MTMDIRIAGIVNESVVDGPGIRMVIFTQGCPHNCPGCHNPETHDFAGGQLRQTEELVSQMANQRYIAGITISGGEPFCQPEPCAVLAEAAHAQGKNVMIYSGYTFEQLLALSRDDENIRRLLNACDILVDGPYIEAQRNLDLVFRGSENQRIIDVPASINKGTPIIKLLGRDARK